MDRMWEDVVAFHDRFTVRPRMALPTPLHRLPERAGLERLRHLKEELDELTLAATVGDVAAQADALADLVYVALGTALMMGLPWREVWGLVHAANMQKAPDPDLPKQVVKPAGWEDPVGAIERLLERRRQAALAAPDARTSL